jgi:hypothetical protein
MNLYSLKFVEEERNQNRHLSYWFVQCGIKGTFPSFCCKDCYITIVICSFMSMCISVFSSTVPCLCVSLSSAQQFHVCVYLCLQLNSFTAMCISVFSSTVSCLCVSLSSAQQFHSYVYLCLQLNSFMSVCISVFSSTVSHLCVSLSSA